MTDARTSCRFSELLVQFAGRLRRAGLDASPACCDNVSQAIKIVNPSSMRELRRVMRMVFADRYEDIATFDRVFSVFWYGERHSDEISATSGGAASGQSGELPREQDRRLPASTHPLEADESPEARETPSEASGFSANTEYWRKRAVDVTDEDISNSCELALELVKRLRTMGAARYFSSPQKNIVDWRRVFRAILRNQGQAMRLYFRRRRPTRPRLVVLCDVSGSMTEHVSRMLAALFALGAVSQKSQLGVFATRLTMFSPDICFRRDPAAAIARACAGVRQWNSGTDIGACLKEFNDTRVLPMSCSFVILSDGWDNGDADIMRKELSRLSTKVRRIVWINPLQGTPGFRPETACLKAALPFVDDFLPGHSIEAVLAACRHIRYSGIRRNVVKQSRLDLVHA